MADPLICFILPTYGHFDYAKRAAVSFFRHTPNGVLLWIDDASPDWSEKQLDQDLRGLPPDRIYVHRYPVNGGLTRSWNYGLLFAKTQLTTAPSHVICGNSDILFTPDYSLSLLAGLEAGYALTGPVSNAAGITADGAQDVAKYFPGYRLTDEAKYLQRVSARLRRKFSDRFIEAPRGVNGFFQFSSLENWWRYPYDKQHVYNPQDVMVNQEDRLQARWRARGAKSATCAGSFIFHYRSVSREAKHRKGAWYRTKKARG